MHLPRSRFRSLLPALAAPLLALAACHGAAGSASDAGSSNTITGSNLGPDEVPLRVDQRCPGDPACAPSTDTTLQVGTAQRDITPFIEPFIDSNGNGIWEPGEPYTDLNGNGKFDAVWMAGFDNGRMAWGVHDATWVRCYVIRQANTTLAHCVVDGVGYFQNEQAQIRADLDPSLGIDLLMMAASHVHETQDTVGIWGPDETTTGYDPVYMKRIRESAISAITEAVNNLKPATMSIGSILVEDPDHDLQPYVSDTRDPVVIDNRMHVMQFDAVADGKPILTVLNWADHPESTGSDNHYITADYTYYLRASLEQHTGSPVVFVNGALGGQIGPGQVRPRMADGTLLPQGERSFRFAEAWGNGLADFAMKAFDARTQVTTPLLAFIHTSFNVHVENLNYQAAFFLHLFNGRDLFGYDPNQPLLRTDQFDNAPLINTEAAYITLGPASISTCPGELLPENYLGGYGGEYRGLYTFIDTTQPNAPDVTKAPKPPYLHDMMDGDPDHHMIFGLTLDMLGYVVPRYDFVLDPLSPYFVDAPGDHYEETNSIGPRAEPEITGTMRQLVLQYQLDHKSAGVAQ